MPHEALPQQTTHTRSTRARPCPCCISSPAQQELHQSGDVLARQPTAFECSSRRARAAAV